MNTEITNYDFHGNSVRVLTDQDDAPWFIAKDICDVLGIDTNHVREGLDDDEITNLRNTEVWNQPGRAPLIVSESGFYKLVMRSRKPVAKEFQRWVTRDLNCCGASPVIYGRVSRWLLWPVLVLDVLFQRFQCGSAAACRVVAGRP